MADTKVKFIVHVMDEHGTPVGLEDDCVFETDTPLPLPNVGESMIVADPEQGNNLWRVKHREFYTSRQRDGDLLYQVELRCEQIGGPNFKKQSS